MLKDYVNIVASKNGSDIHLVTDRPAMARIDGKISEIDTKKLDENSIWENISTYLSDAQQQEFKDNLELDCAVQVGDTRLRLNLYRTVAGISAALRLINSNSPTLEALNSPEIIKQIANKHSGLILVTGATGSGKSTTLAAIIDYINNTQNKHILTVEDPVEYIHQSKQSLINQRELGSNTKSFTRALKSALREDPDVIMVGELRDLETIKLALTAAETGHLVLGTLHTNSASKTVDRIIDVFPGDERGLINAMLSTSLQAVISQKLLPSVGGGRVAAMEIMIANSAIRNLIREGKTEQINSIIQMGSRSGMETMELAIQSLLREGKISQEIAEANIKGESSSSGGNQTTQSQAPQSNSLNNNVF